MAKLSDRKRGLLEAADVQALLEHAIAAPDTPLLALRLPHGRASSVKTQAPIRRPRHSDHS
jgi:hypothetical protein